MAKFLSPILIGGSTAIQMLAAMDRFLAIKYPFSYKTVVTRRNIILSYLISLFFQLVWAIHNRFKGPTDFLPVSIVTAVAYVIMIVWYVWIFRHITKAKIRSEIPIKRTVSKTFTEITKTIALASFVRSFCYIPFMIAFPVIEINSEPQRFKLYHWKHLWLSMVCYDTNINFGSEPCNLLLEKFHNAS